MSSFIYPDSYTRKWFNAKLTKKKHESVNPAAAIVAKLSPVQIKHVSIFGRLINWFTSLFK